METAKDYPVVLAAYTLAENCVLCCMLGKNDHSIVWNVTVAIVSIFWFPTKDRVNHQQANLPIHNGTSRGDKPSTLAKLKIEQCPSVSMMEGGERDCHAELLWGVSYPWLRILLLPVDRRPLHAPSTTWHATRKHVAEPFPTSNSGNSPPSAKPQRTCWRQRRIAFVGYPLLYKPRHSISSPFDWRESPSTTRASWWRFRGNWCSRPSPIISLYVVMAMWENTWKLYVGEI